MDTRRRPTRSEVEGARNARTVRDVLGPGLRLLLVGINPGLYSGATGHHFARPGNRFWPALHRSGLTPRLFHPSEAGELPGHGIGLTKLVHRATATAAELTREELVSGGRELRELVRRLRPGAVCFLGAGAYCGAFGMKRVRMGRQESSFEGAALWVLPNPSGLNANYQLPDFVRMFRELKEAAGGGMEVARAGRPPDGEAPGARAYAGRMQSKAATVEQYLAQLPDDRREAIQSVRRVFLENLDKDYAEGMSYGMIGYCVPHSVFPAGYHCDPRQPLPFAGLGNQKGHMSLYLACVYGNGPMQERFRRAWARTGKKLDMGKACIRFKRVEDLALDVIAETIRSLPARKYVEQYQKSLASMASAKAKARGERPAAKRASAKAGRAKAGPKKKGKARGAPAARRSR